jgi:hypothetical protein
MFSLADLFFLLGAIIDVLLLPFHTPFIELGFTSDRMVLLLKSCDVSMRVLRR